MAMTQGNKMGRPTDYTDEMAEEICAWVGSGLSLREYCEQDGTPTFSTVYKWARDREEFSLAFAHARETQAHNDADRLNHLANRLERGQIPPDVARVCGDLLKWTAAKRAPKAYGDKLALLDTHGGPITISWEGPDK